MCKPLGALMLRPMLAANDAYPQGIPQNIRITNGSRFLQPARQAYFAPAPGIRREIFARFIDLPGITVSHVIWQVLGACKISLLRLNTQTTLRQAGRMPLKRQTGF